MPVGEIVLVKSFPNDPVIRRIFEEIEDGAMICLEEEFRLWEDRGIKPQAVKCPQSRIFQYDNDLFLKLKEAAYSLGDNNLLNTLWSRAQRYYSHECSTWVGKQC